MVVVKPVRINERHVALTILGDDLFRARLYFIGDLGQAGPRLGERNDVLGTDGHVLPPGVSHEIMYAILHVKRLLNQAPSMKEAITRRVLPRGPVGPGARAASGGVS